MEVSQTFDPSEVFASAARGGLPLPRVFIAPQRYIQGPRVLRDLGRHLSLLPAKRVALLMSQRGSQSEGPSLIDGLQAEHIQHVLRIFGGECSLDEIEGHTRALETEAVDCVIAAGGGKCIDAGKAVAHRLGVPVVIAPTLASNDAPCSALSILYSADGVSQGAEFYPSSPAIVVVDTEIVAQAPERTLVAGIGDAMATWYEARVCLLNPAAITTIGARPTIASAAIGEACAEVLFARGVEAAAAVAANRLDESLESIIEANTLLSGLGFESGGLAAAHGVAQSYTHLPTVQSNYLHGELVAMGTLAQLMLESRREEAAKVARFFACIGLPIHLGQLCLDEADSRSLNQICEGTLDFPFTGNMPQLVTARTVRTAVLDAHALGTDVASEVGDTAYRRLHAQA